MNFISLDISTAIIGYAIWQDQSLIKYGHINLTKIEKDPFLKLDVAKTELIKLCQANGVTHMVAEAALQKFTAGKSSAATMNLLMAFNFALSYEIRCAKIEVSHVSFAHARKLTGIQFVKKSKPKDKKELIRQYCEKKYPFIVWEKKKTGTYKDACFDTSDAIILGETCFQSSGKDQDNQKSVPKRVRKASNQ